MAVININRRDITFFEYLHTCKVATTKQINRDVFQTSHATCYQRLQKYLEAKLIKHAPTDRKRDHSFAYEVTPKGEKIIKRSLSGMLNGSRFKSNSMAHDLRLVDIRNVLMSRGLVKEYYTENQIQTYTDFRTEAELLPYQELQSDAVMMLEKEGVKPIYVAIEYEASLKTKSRYRDKLRRFYYSRATALFYICESKSLERKLRKIEEEVIKDSNRRIYYITAEEFFRSQEFVTFTGREGLKFEV